MNRIVSSTPRMAPLAAAVLIAFPLDAWSAAGKVIFAAGEVRLAQNGQAAGTIGRGAEVEQGDLIVTGANGFAQLLMEDGGRVTLRANSQLKLDEFKYGTKRQKSDRSIMSLLAGSMRAVTGLIGHNNRNNYKIKTPTATIGIRGSDGNVGYDPLIGASVQTLAGGHTLTGVDARGVEHTLILKPGDVGLLPPGAVAPVKVDNFPFSTAQPAQSQAQVRPGSNTETSTASASAATEGETATAADLTARESTVVSDSTAITNDAPTIATVTLPPPPPPTQTTDPVPPPPPPPKDPVPVASTTFIGLVTATNTGGGGFSFFDAGSMDRSPSDQKRDANGNLTEYLIDNWGGWDNGIVFIVNGAASPTTPIQTASGATLGNWQGRADGSSKLGLSISQENAGRTVNWAYAQAGYYDLSQSSMPLTGTMNYTGYNLGGHASGIAAPVVLNSANLNADFSNQTVAIALGLTVGSTQWTANTISPVYLYSQGSDGYINGFDANTEQPTLNVVNNLGQSGSTHGYIKGSFTGANFSGALLEYDFSQEDATNGDIVAGVKGIVGFKADGPVTAPAIVQGPSLTEYVVVSDIGTPGDMNHNEQIVSEVDTATHSGWAYTDAGGYSEKVEHVNGTQTVNPLWSNGIQSGMWHDGVLKSTSQEPMAANESFSWGLIEKPAAWYLPSILTGTASYVVDQALAPNSTDDQNWTLSTTATKLDVDFTNQTVDATVSIKNAQDVYLLSTTDAPLKGQNGQFSASTYASGGYEGSLVIKRNGVEVVDSSAYGRLRGELGGQGLSGAVLGYYLGTFCFVSSCTWTDTYVNGVVAFKGTAQNEATPYSIVNIAINTSLGDTTTIGFNTDARLTGNASSGLTGFDIWSDFDKIVRYESGTSTVKDIGTHSATGLSWGRWEGTAMVKDRVTGTTIDSADHVHYVVSKESGPAQLPKTGIFEYVKVGHTSPTDQNGNVGLLQSATLTADFTNRAVDVNVRATVGATTFEGAGSGIKLFDNAFHADTAGGGSGGMLNVNCSGGCGTHNSGSVTGQFTGVGAIGAGLTYSLGSDNGAVINGAVAFERK